jgi:hypothetical protein
MDSLDLLINELNNYADKLILERHLNLIDYYNQQLYDKKTKRMQLWHRTDPSSNEKSPSPEPDETEATFQIMLCDYCDAEFYSDEVLEVSKIYTCVLYLFKKVEFLYDFISIPHGVFLIRIMRQSVAIVVILMIKNLMNWKKK